MDEKITKEAIRAKMLQQKIDTAFVLSSGRYLKGRYFIEEFGQTRKSPQIIYNSSPYIADRHSNLNEILSKMLEAGEKELPVINNKRQFVGIIRLDDIFKEVNKKIDSGVITS